MPTDGDQADARGDAPVLPFLAALAVLGAGSVSAGPPPLFEAPWTGFDTGSWDDGFGPRSMAEGDLDGDGDVDVLVGLSYFGSPGVAVLLNDGEGSFRRTQLAALPWNEVVGQVRLADVDQDEDLDALATMPGSDERSRVLLLWRNDGTAGFTGPENFLAGAGCFGLAVADFDRNGHPDVVTANQDYNGSGTSVSLLLHDGGVGAAAGFRPPRTFEVGVGPRFVEAGDLDGDGWPDLAVARSELATPWVSVLLNDGAGGFLPPFDLPSGIRGTPVVELGDLDGDEDLDIVTGWQDNAGSVSYGTVRVHWNGGGASFASFTDHRLDAFAADPEDVELADLDGDGLVDILTANANGRALEGWRVLPNLDGSSFGPAQARACSQNTEALLVANLDEDCDLDVLTLARFSSALTVHLNLGDGLFTQPAPHPLSRSATELDAGDLDGDDDLDLLLIGNGVEWLQNDGSGGFAPAVPYSAIGTVTSGKLRDLDGDGRPDLLLNGAPGGGFSVSLNDGAGGFGPATPWSLDACNAETIDAFDLDDDGDLDVVMSGCVAGFAGYLFVARNDGAANFSAEPHVPTLVRTRGLAAADLNGDRHLDLVSIESGFGLGAYLGDGALGFAAGLVGSEPAFLFALGRFDDDDLVDAAIQVPADSFGSDRVGIARGNGDGTFAAASFVPGSSVLEALRIAVDLEVGDVDCDERPDVIVTNYASNDVSVFLTQPDGSLGPHVRHGANLTPLGSVLADLTGDGLLDLAVSSQEVGPPAVGPSLIVLPGTCGRTRPGSGAGGGPPEIDPRSLRVGKSGPGDRDVEIAFDASFLPASNQHANVHRGRLATLATPRSYDHAPLDGGCHLEAAPAVDRDGAAPGAPDWYYLAVRACSAKGTPIEGGYGFGFDGRAPFSRPDSLEASGMSCP